MTYEEFLRAYDGRNAEWVEGEVIEMSPTSWENQDLAGFLTAILRSFVEAKDLGVMLSSRFQMKMPARAAGREPDVLFLSAAHRDRLRRNYLDGPADLAVEIVSPDSVTRDRVEKYREYEAGGVCATRNTVRLSSSVLGLTAVTARFPSTARECFGA